MEAVVEDALMEHMTQCDFFSVSQHGFLPNKIIMYNATFDRHELLD